MARLARAVAPGLPHHVTQRGNRRQTVFFSDADYQAYRGLVAEHCAAAGVAVWGYCLMPNHVHLILVPPDEDALRHALGEAHRRYTRRVNLAGKDDTLVTAAPLLALAPDWKAFLAEALDEDDLEALRRHARTGRPLGSERFVEALETRLGRTLKPGKRGRKPKAKPIPPAAADK